MVRPILREPGLGPCRRDRVCCKKRQSLQGSLQPDTRQQARSVQSPQALRELGENVARNTESLKSPTTPACLHGRKGKGRSGLPENFHVEAHPSLARLSADERGRNHPMLGGYRHRDSRHEHQTRPRSPSQGRQPPLQWQFQDQSALRRSQLRRNSLLERHGPMPRETHLILEPGGHLVLATPSEKAAHSRSVEFRPRTSRGTRIGRREGTESQSERDLLHCAWTTLRLCRLLRKGNPDGP
jgi:hypothetical protein